MARKLTFIAVVFALAMCVLVVPAASTTFASESPSTEYYNVQYDFSYEETVMPTNQIVRKYEKPTSFLGLSNTTTSLTKTKAILASLGMGEDFIDELSNEQLNEYANSKSITATTSYIKTTPEGLSTYVTEEEAQNGARGFGPGPGTGENNFGDDEGTDLPNPSWNTELVDEYMALVFTVADIGEGFYHFSVDAEWLQRPYYYHVDSLGACAQNCYVMNSSRSGWYSWTGTSIYDENDTISDRVTITESDFGNATNGSWAGTAARINLPNTEDLYFQGFYAYTEIKLHVDFYISMSDYNSETYFNAVATHTHHHLTLDIDSAIRIILNNNTNEVAIGVDAWWGMEYRNATFNTPFHYIPD